MNYELRITRHAFLDVQEASDYIEFELYNPDAAYELQDEFEETAHSLLKYPFKFPLAPDEVLRNWGIRFVMVKDYYLLYTIRGDKIYVVRFLHQRRDWIGILRQGVDLE